MPTSTRVRLRWSTSISGSSSTSCAVATGRSPSPTRAALSPAYISLAAGSGTYVAPVDGAADRVVTIQAGTAGGHLVRVTTSAHTGAGGCVFYAQAVVH